ncbi:t-SNARE VTI1 [Malassezia vespertilionis]|uniref:t-SNARE coiled-coil homology domain-containing protein n=1 Tax=Malassezia vespertilionis TaxID=2020962 RepID=A0A2N1JGM5_9BASI|nr:t-SNARE VTI1 [Malassezia vespertilionis]PKI85701.1 hypothetical protein MVES_000394 [Malassezia vespertilionis]WFD05096.1 t-SNARE VTI1 [Malassezia vespertilionis]
MAELFESYASDFAQVLKSAEGRLAINAHKMSADALRTVLRHAEAEADEAGELCSQMEIEVQGFPQSVRDRYAGKLQSLKGDLDMLHRKLRAAKQPDSGSGLPLDGYRDQDEGQTTDAAFLQRQRMLEGTSLLEQGTERLENSTRLALESEDIGANILQDLRGQREQLEHSRNTLHTADAHIGRSSRTLQQMIRRAKQQKLVTTAIVVVLVLLILLILYSKL